jgi:hypothetical protein
MQMMYFSYAFIASAISWLNSAVVTKPTLREATEKGKPKSACGGLKGARQKSSKLSITPFFVVVVYVYGIYYKDMNTRPTPQSVLQDIAQIQRLDRGTVSVLRQGPEGPYYNHQCYENGRNVSRYVPSEQVPELKESIANFHRFEQLMKQYVDLMVGKTRAEREAGSKKKTPPPNSSWPKTRKSNS